MQEDSDSGWKRNKSGKIVREKPHKGFPSTEALSEINRETRNVSEGERELQDTTLKSPSLSGLLI